MLSRMRGSSPVWWRDKVWLGLGGGESRLFDSDIMANSYISHSSYRVYGGLPALVTTIQLDEKTG